MIVQVKNVKNKPTKYNVFMEIIAKLKIGKGSSSVKNPFIAISWVNQRRVRLTKLILSDNRFNFI